MNWPLIQGVTPPSLSDNSAAGYFWDDTPKPAVQQQEADEDPGTLAINIPALLRRQRMLIGPVLL